MKKRNLDKTELDLIGRKLIELGSVPSVDIDQIVSNPDLFSLVNAKIAADANTKTTASGWVGFTYIRGNAVAFAGAAVMLIAVIAAASLLRSEKVTPVVNIVQIPAAVLPEAARPDLPPKEQVGRNQSPGRAQNSDFQFEKAVVRQTMRPIERKPRQAASIEPEAEFYAISSSGGTDETGDGQIIRVDMPRSSLLALGVNMPLENDSEIVKADLLVGANGVARAIRVIK